MDLETNNNQTTEQNEQIVEKGEPHKKPNFFKTKNGFITIGIITLVLIISGILFNNHRVQQQKIEAFNTYKEDFTITLSLLESEYEKNFDILNQTQDTWHEAIFGDGDTDFNTALVVLYLGFEEDGVLKDLKLGRDKIDSEIQKIQNPHPQFETIYQDMIDLYALYTQANDLADNPTGSFESYSAQVEEYSSEFNQSFSKLKVRMPQDLKE